MINCICWSYFLNIPNEQGANRAVALDIGVLVALNKEARKWLKRNSKCIMECGFGIYEWPTSEEFVYDSFQADSLYFVLDKVSTMRFTYGVASCGMNGSEITIKPDENSPERNCPRREPNFNEWSK